MIIFIIFFFLLFFSVIFEIKYISKGLILVFTILAFLIFTINITYTADWNNYSNIFENQDRETKDFFIRFLSLKFAEFGFDYQKVFQFHILVIGVLFSYFSSKFLKNSLIVILLFLFICYVPLVNQIRFFLAFIFFLFSIYYFFLKSYKKFAILALLALTNHIGIIPLYIVLLFIRKDVKIRYHVFLSIIIYIAVFSLINFNFIEGFEGFNIYVKDEMRSTLLGGILKILPSVITLVLIYHLSRRISAKTEYNNFLHRVSFFPIIFLPAATLNQIIGDRYVFIFSFIWLIYLTYLIRLYYSDLLVRKLIIILYAIFIWLVIYYLPKILFGNSFLLDEFILTYKSII